MLSHATLQSVIKLVDNYYKMLPPRGFISKAVAPALDPPTKTKLADGKYQCKCELWTQMGEDLVEDSQVGTMSYAPVSSDPDMETKTFTAHRQRRRMPFPDTQLSASESVSIQALARLVKAKRLKLNKELDMIREYKTSTYVRTSGNYASGNTSSISGSGWDTAGSDPLGNFQDMAQAIEDVDITDIIIPYNVYMELSRHSQLTSFMKTTDGLATFKIIQERVSELFGNDVVVHIPKVKYLVSGVKTPVWGKDVVAFNSGRDYIESLPNFANLTEEDIAQEEFPASFRTLMPSMRASRIWREEGNETDWYESSETYGLASVLIDNATDNNITGAYLLRDVIA